MKSTSQLSFDIEMRSLSTTNHWMARPWFVLVTCILLFITFTSFYLFLPPELASQPWDSLEYAYSTEVDGIRSIRGNHPLGHVIFFTLFTLAKQLGYDGRALAISQATNGVLGGLIIAIFFVVLASIIKVRVLYALGYSLVLGSCYSFWFFAGTGDIYHLSILFSLLAWASLAYEITLKDRPFPILSGILTGLSILSHQLNTVLIPVGLALILLTPDSGNRTIKVKTKQIAIFLGAASVMAALGYLLLGYIATSSFSLARVIGWMQGYFGDSTYGRYLTIEYFKTAWTTVSQGVLFSPQNKYEFISSGLLAFFLFVMFVGLLVSSQKDGGSGVFPTSHFIEKIRLLAKKALSGRKRAIMIASALGCFITWPLILWWEPENPKFWLLTLPLWIIVLALSVETVETGVRNWLPKFSNIPSRTAKALPFIVGVILLSVNIQHIEDKTNAVAFNEAMELWLNNSSPDDVIITAGDLVPHLRYWGKRPNTVYLYRSLQASQNSPNDFRDLREEIKQALCTHRTVLITPAASEYILDSQLSLVSVSREELNSFLDEHAYRGEIIFWYRNVFDGKLLPVYALRRSGACLDQKSASHLN